jgi:diaminopimelate epimerase
MAEWKRNMTETEKAPRGIPFYKMSGAGNDFILVDNREGIVSEENLPQWIEKVCTRRLSVGADGLILIETSEWANFSWRFFNRDGGEAEMCGNGARCAARFAFLNTIAGRYMSFETLAGIVNAEVVGRKVRVKLVDPESAGAERMVELKGGAVSCFSINTGVPHAVLRVKDLETADILGMGRELRNHPDFAPAGTNVNFVSSGPGGAILMRTYERGVEDETLACGTGAVAAALAEAAKWAESPVTVITRSGAPLKVYFRRDEDRFFEVQLEGEARVIYTGLLHKEAVSW